MKYFVLAGGFWAQSKNADMCSRQVDQNSPSMMRGMDYVIGIEGLPESVLQPEGKSSVLTYWCTQCNRAVPQNHMEMHYGCALNHKVETKAIEEDLWQSGVFEKYKLKTAPWIDGYRIWFDNNNGVEKWKQIYAIIEGHCRSKGIPTPTPRRISEDGHAVILVEDIPNIILEVKETKKDVPEVEVKAEEVKPKKEHKVKIYKCDKCGEEARGYFGYYQHMLRKHKIDLKEEKINVHNDDSNTDTADTVDDKESSKE